MRHNHLRNSDLPITPTVTLADLAKLSATLPRLDELKKIHKHSSTHVNVALIALGKLAVDLDFPIEREINGDLYTDMGKEIASLGNRCLAPSASIDEVINLATKAKRVRDCLLDLKAGIAEIGGRLFLSEGFNHRSEGTIQDGSALFHINLATGQRTALAVPGESAFAPTNGFVPFKKENGDLGILDIENHKELPLPEGVKSIELFTSERGDVFAKLSEYDPTSERRGEFHEQFICLTNNVGWTVKLQGAGYTNPVPVASSHNRDSEVSLSYWKRQGRDSVLRPFNLQNLIEHKVHDSIAKYSIHPPLKFRSDLGDRNLAVGVFCKETAVFDIENGREIKPPTGKNYSEVLGIDLIQGAKNSVFAKVSLRTGGYEIWRLDNKCRFRSMKMNFSEIHQTTPDSNGEIFIVGMKRGEGCKIHHSSLSNTVDAPDFNKSSGLIPTFSGSCIVGINEGNDSYRINKVDLNNGTFCEIQTPPGISISAPPFTFTNQLDQHGLPEVLLLGRRNGGDVIIDISDQCS